VRFLHYTCRTSLSTWCWDYALRDDYACQRGVMNGQLIKSQLPTTTIQKISFKLTPPTNSIIASYGQRGCSKRGFACIPNEFLLNLKKKSFHRGEKKCWILKFAGDHSAQFIKFLLIKLLILYSRLLNVNHIQKLY